MTPSEKEQLLFNFWRRQREAGLCPIDATSAMGEFGARLDRAAEQVADDKFHRDLAVIKACMERTR